MATAKQGLDDSAAFIRDIVRNLDRISGLDCIWKRGVVHAGGPHYRLKGTLGPVSLGEDECGIFGRLIRGFRPANCFIIGNAFGMSSVYIAKMMELHGGTSVITLDSKSEGDGERCFTIAAALRDRLQCRILKNKVGWSPKDIAGAVESTSYDLIFIDGDHSHPQVTKDLHGIMSLVHARTIVCWHDYWMKGVPQSVAEAENCGFSCVKVNSSCEMVFGTRNPEILRRLQAVFPGSEPPRPRYRALAWAKLYNSLLIGAVKLRLGMR